MTFIYFATFSLKKIYIFYEIHQFVIAVAKNIVKLIFLSSQIPQTMSFASNGYTKTNLPNPFNITIPYNLTYSNVQNQIRDDINVKKSDSQMPRDLFQLYSASELLKAKLQQQLQQRRVLLRTILDEDYRLENEELRAQGKCYATS